MKQIEHNPDVLNCLANLSNDEVFTPPALVNQMLDLLPQELFKDPNSTFLDPFCKTGVFLREIVKRLDKGLEDVIPDRQERIDHILHKQVFGMAITELTSLLTRRTLYCSKFANGEHSISRFDTPEGNIWYKPIKHTWVNGKCKFCGATQALYDRASEEEQYAYPFIHLTDLESIYNMKFSVICGNPPYQLNVGIEQESYGIPLYQHFVSVSKKLKPDYISMIMPSRWYAGGRGLDDFREEMLHDDRLRKLHDYPDSGECFPGVEIKGGVCYFLWEGHNGGLCSINTHANGKIISSQERALLENGMDTFIRFNEAIPILHKVRKLHEESFASYVSPQTPFGLISSFSNYKTNSFPGSIKLYITKGSAFVDKSLVTKGKELIDKIKIYITKSYGAGEGFPHQILNKPFIGEAGSCCTQTYLAICPFDSITEANNAMSYMKTKFFRFLVMLRKNTQDAMRGVYELVPVQDWSKPWTDVELYKKYNLSQEEIDYIESMIKPME